MKLGVKTKLIAGGIAVMLASGSTGIMLWHHQQSAQETAVLAISQAGQQKNLSPISKNKLQASQINKLAPTPGALLRL
jgi:hypothetical protein